MFAYGSLCLPQQTKNHIRTTNQPTALSWTLGCHYITYTATSSPDPANHTLRHPPYHSTTGISNTHWTVHWSFPNYIGAAYTSAHNPIPPQYEPQPFAPKLHNLNTFLPTWLHVVHILDMFKQNTATIAAPEEFLSSTSPILRATPWYAWQTTSWTSGLTPWQQLKIAHNSQTIGEIEYGAATLIALSDKRCHANRVETKPKYGRTRHSR